MKRNTIIRLLLAAAVIVCALPAHADRQESLLRVQDIKVARHGQELYLDIKINPARVNPGRDRQVVFTPVLRSDNTTDSIELTPVVIAGRNMYYSNLRNGSLPEGVNMYRAGSREIIHYHCSILFDGWMQTSHLYMRQAVAKCCDSPLKDPDTPLAQIDLLPPTYQPQFAFVELTGDSVIEMTAEGRAYIDFVVNRTEIRPDYRRNKVELAKIIESIDKVRNDPDVTITGLTIKGFASPEGSYQNNVRLAVGRTESLKEYVRTRYNFDPLILSTDYEPEDWTGLRAYLVNSDLPHRDEIIRIIDTTADPDPRNTAIQRTFPREYKFLLDSVYPSLRHSDYTVRYRVNTYATVEQLLEVFRTTPERMRPVDFQRIAARYTPGTAEYNAIMLKAVEIHPYDPQSNLNAATIAMQAGDLAAAANYLDRAGTSAEATYSRGTFAAMTGDLTRAMQYFDSAATLGLPAATAQKQYIDSLLTRTGVTYLIETDDE